AARFLVGSNEVGASIRVSTHLRSLEPSRSSVGMVWTSPRFRPNLVESPEPVQYVIDSCPGQQRRDGAESIHSEDAKACDFCRVQTPPQALILSHLVVADMVRDFDLQ